MLSSCATRRGEAFGSRSPRFAVGGGERSAANCASPQLAGCAGGLRQRQGGRRARGHPRRPGLHPPERGGGLCHLQSQEREEDGGM